jgi:hypothetical protein
VSRARGTKKRFGYLAAAGEPPAEEREKLVAGPETESARQDRGLGPQGPDEGGGEGRSATRQRPRSRRKPAAQQLASVPKGEGRMKQERSQLNVRIPTALKRQAAAKAVLEGKDIGEVVEDLLRQYIER